MTKTSIPLFLLLAISLFGGIKSLSSSIYRTYYIEDECKTGKETISYSLTSTNALTSTAIIKSTKNYRYLGNRNCTAFVRGAGLFGNGITLSVRKIDFSRSAFCKDFLQVFYQFTSYKLCNYKYDVDEFESYSTSDPMKLYYHTEPASSSYQLAGFEVVVTAYNTYDCFGDNRFKCDNGHCIWRNLTCDGHNNCGDRSDENAFTCRFGLLPAHKALIALGVILFILCVVFGVVRFVRRRTTVIESTIHISPNQQVTSMPAPYQAMHPQGGFISQNPSGQMTVYPPPQQNQAGFTNPCYPTGIPPAGPYGQPTYPAYKG